MLVSIIIRTLNEEKYLGELFDKIHQQDKSVFDIETVVVDSGSTDQTLQIARKNGAELVYITKDEFSFGRSLNIGCEKARGDILVFISGHCVPVNNQWINTLCTPIKNGDVCYSYGKQIGRDTTKFSESRVFLKYFPNESAIPQTGFFCNNANAAIRRSNWEGAYFDEDLTGLEDMHTAKRLFEAGERIGYCADAPVYHIHNEGWKQIRRRYEREAIALRHIHPEIHMTHRDFAWCFLSSVTSDLFAATQQRKLLRETSGIFAFRLHQFWGSYRGNHLIRAISKESKKKYFYPSRPINNKSAGSNDKSYSVNAIEGEQHTS
ncbi:Uncharacterised protein [BD1-7 clade bacterium]|uniref:Glycosyltransferase 2-like domain-containing protein n=1 Tax=BD1-7 clade bacterium TaxID=2029982 RepID=A0A5S9R0Z2_9GAMM|nr:Uncharacterised protein [BD1-7 clade bacterium]